MLKSTNKNFALLLSVVCFFLGFKLSHFFYLLAFGVFVGAFGAPKLFSIPNKMWILLGDQLQKIISPIILTGLYFLIVVPLGFVISIFKNNFLNLKIQKAEKSYWILSDENKIKSSMKNQF